MQQKKKMKVKYDITEPMLLVNMYTDYFNISRDKWSKTCFSIMDSKDKEEGIAATYENLGGPKGMVYIAGLLGITEEEYTKMRQDVATNPIYGGIMPH